MTRLLHAFLAAAFSAVPALATDPAHPVVVQLFVNFTSAPPFQQAQDLLLAEARSRDQSSGVSAIVHLTIIAALHLAHEPIWVRSIADGQYPTAP